MEGKTHRAGGMLVALGGYYYLKSKGFLLEGVTPLVQLAVIYPFSIVGSLLPDQDHHEESAPLKDVISWAFCKILHLTTNVRKNMLKAGVSKKNLWYKLLGIFDARHRSWQTHSDLALLVVVYLMLQAFRSPGLLTVEVVILKLIYIGLVLGLVSHLILDMLTPAGVHFLFGVVANKLFGKKILPEKLRLVPRMQFFATGGVWESWWRYCMTFASIVMLGYLIYDMLPYALVLNQ